MTRAQIKYIRSLGQKKFRKESGLFVVEGIKLVRELVQSDFIVQEIFAESSELVSPGIDFTEAKNSDLQEASGLKTSPGVLAVCVQKNWKLVSGENLDGITLLLDGIADPGNLGTIIRSAEWFGVNQVICSLETVELFNPKVVQSTMGSLFRVPVIYMDLIPAIEGLRANGLPIWGADLAGNDYRKMSSERKPAIVIGSESHGISRPVRDQLDAVISIPGSGRAESLNAAIATAILCSRFVG